MDVFGDLDNMTKAVVFGVQAILVIFWVISPIGGFIMARGIRSRSTSVIIIAAMTILLNVIFVGLSYVLTEAYEMAHDTALIIALITAVIVSTLLGALTLYLYRNERSQIDDELRNLIANDELSGDFSFQQRRQKRIRRRASKR